MAQNNAQQGGHKYSLTGPQVEPGAGYWMFCPQLHIVGIDELTRLTDDAASPHFFPAPPAEDGPQTEQEMDELLELARWCDDPCHLVHEDKDRCPRGEGVPCQRAGELPGAFGCRRPISKLLNLAPPPLGAVLVNRFPGEQIIRTGRGMARAVESETPGLFHRHAFNYLISTRSWSPPRQALVWAALDVALASALQAAWYYKWISPRTAFRERPIEYSRRHKSGLHVLFDRPDELNPAYNLCSDARPNEQGHFPDNASGTPRHPAYPSGHSTYSGAACEILNFFFGVEKTPSSLPAHPPLGSQPGTTIGEELDNMADNIGMGRLWAGIHWRSDHEAGLQLGRTVACLVLQQLARMESGLKHGFKLCPPDRATLQDQCNRNTHVPCNTDAPPTRQELEDEANQRKAGCPSSIPAAPPVALPVDRCDAPPDPIAPPPDPTAAPPDPTAARLDANRGVQQGAR